ncbi:hypothetical protein BsWGS_23776 [Bradybaena similaris]
MLGFVLVLGLAVPSVFCGLAGGWFEHNGFLYSFSDHALNFVDANAKCSASGARLAQIDNQDKQDWIAAQLKKLGVIDAYFGGSSREQVSVWKWVPSQEPFKYTNWYPGEPNYPDGSRCVFLEGGKNYTWDNVPCDRPFNYVCEKRACSCPWSGCV